MEPIFGSVSRSMLSHCLLICFMARSTSWSHICECCWGRRYRHLHSPSIL